MPVLRFRLVLSLLFLTIFPAQAVPIKGRVVGPDDKPVAGAEVVIQAYTAMGNIRKFVELTTNENGEFATDVEMSPFRSGYLGSATAFKPGLAIGGVALKTQENLIRLEAARQVSGKAVDTEGRPVAGVMVALRSVEWKGEPRLALWLTGTPLQKQVQTVSGADGTWTIAGLPLTGETTLEINDPRFVRTSVQAKGQDSAAITVRPGAVLTGRVLLPNGQPAPGIQVSASARQQNSWAQDTTADGGTYRLTGLATGIFNVSVKEPTGEMVAVTLENVSAEEGQSTPVNDIKLTSGVVVEGLVTDAVTGKPLSHISIGSQNSTQGYSSASTDATGHYKLRVPPGRHGFYIMSNSENYLAPEEGSPNQLKYLTLKEGQTETLSFQLPPALVLSGLAVDEAGKPAGGAKLVLSTEDWRAYSYQNPTTTTQADGSFQFKTLRPGEHTVRAAGAWEVVSPSTLTLPVAGEIKVVLRALNLLALQGRVVTSEGKPIEDATIAATIVPATHQPGVVYSDQKTLKTNAAGQFLLTDLRPDSSITLRATQSGYRFMSGGTATKKEGQFVVSDIILLPLSNRIAGRVVNAEGQPVAGAEVLSPDGKSGLRAVTDQAGRFMLEQLPAGEVLVLAVKDGKIGQARGTDEIEIALSTPQPVTFDLWRAYNILQEVWEQSRDTQYYRRYTLPGLLAPHDPDLMLQLATDPYGHVSHQVLSHSITNLAKYDPAMAAIWAPRQLERITEPSSKLLTTVTLGTHLTEDAPDIAAQLYEQAKQEQQTRAGLGNEWQQILVLNGLGELAAKLKHDEAEQWFEQAMTTATRSTAESRVQLMTLALQAQVPFNPQSVEKLGLQLPDVKEPAPGWTLAEIIRRMARVDKAAAQRLLLELEERSQEERSQFIVSRAQRAVATALAKDDPQAALKLARRIHQANDKSLALAACAALLPPDQQTTVFREALMVAFGEYRSSALGGKVAALAFRTDPELGRALFQEILTRTNSTQDRYSRDRGNASLAYYLRLADPAAARLLLETEYSRLREAGDNNQNGEIQQVATAMAAINVDRAVGMANTISIEGDRSFARFEALRQIAQYLLTPPENRAALSFDHWNRSGEWLDGNEDE